MEIEKELYDIIYEAIQNEGITLYHLTPRVPVPGVYALIGATQTTYDPHKDMTYKPIGNITVEINVWGSEDQRWDVANVVEKVYSKLSDKLQGEYYNYQLMFNTSNHVVQEMVFEDVTMWNGSMGLSFNFN
jgi:cephalosporin-C deacetylase-like acetyl esterase